MENFLFWIAMLALVAGLMVAGAWYLRNYQAGGGTGSGLFGPKPEKRLGFVEQMSLDGRRKVVLIRRDDVEHLIMTGGPVDVVIESGIGQRTSRIAGDVTPAVFTRQPRAYGQTGTE